LEANIALLTSPHATVILELRNMMDSFHTNDKNLERAILKNLAYVVGEP